MLFLKNQSSCKIFYYYFVKRARPVRETLLFGLSPCYELQILFYCRSPELKWFTKEKAATTTKLHIALRPSSEAVVQLILNNKKGNISFFWWRSLLRWQCVGEVIIPPMVRCSRIITPFLCSLAWRYSTTTDYYHKKNRMSFNLFGNSFIHPCKSQREIFLVFRYMYDDSMMMMTRTKSKWKYIVHTCICICTCYSKIIIAFPSSYIWSDDDHFDLCISSM